jgi:hypothetical protein
MGRPKKEIPEYEVVKNPTVIHDLTPPVHGSTSETFYYVRDLCATNGTRVHDIVDYSTGQMERLHFPQMPNALLLPERLCMLLTRNVGFEVRRPDGSILTSAKGKDGTQYMLGEDECVATYDELTLEGLRRVARESAIAVKQDDTKADIIRKLAGSVLAENSVGVIVNEEALALDKDNIVTTTESGVVDLDSLLKG